MLGVRSGEDDETSARLLHLPGETFDIKFPHGLIESLRSPWRGKLCEVQWHIKP